MTEMKTSDDNDFQNANRSDSESEPHIMTQEAMDEQIKNYIAVLTKLQNDLTRLTQGMSRTHQVKLPLMVNTSASFSAADTSSDISFSPVCNLHKSLPNSWKRLEKQFKNCTLQTNNTYTKIQKSQENNERTTIMNNKSPLKSFAFFFHITTIDQY